MRSLRFLQVFIGFVLPSVTKNRSLKIFSNGWVGDDEFQMSFPFWVYIWPILKGHVSFRECIHPGKLTWNQKMEV